MLGTRKRSAGLILALFALSVGIGVAAGFGILQLTKPEAAVEVVDGPEQRAAVQETSKAAIEQIFTYRADTAETHYKSVLTLMTHDYGAEFLQKVPSADKLAGANFDAKVVGNAVVSLSTTDASCWFS